MTELRKGRASRKKCYALNATEGYISGWLNPYPEYSSLWRPVSTCTESGTFEMSFYHGLGMFLFGMGAFIVGAIIAYYIINKYVDNDENNNN